MARSYTLHQPKAAVPKIDFAAELNEQQLAAVTSPPGAALVIAGAGSGKTRALTYRVAYLLSQGVPAHNILLLTFTNKAARGMIERVRSLVPGLADGVWGGTFHSIGNRILRRHADRIGFRAGFTIMDREDQEDMIKGLLTRAGINAKKDNFPKASVLADIHSYAINTGKLIPMVLSEKYHYFMGLEAKIAEVLGRYEARKKEANAMDFDDLLCKTLELFLTNEDVAAEYQKMFRHVLVDEYQDTNRIQAELVETLARLHGNIMVVGDDAQSIYSWRGANFENILQFPQKHPEARVFKIETNYRSVPEVLNLANAAILGNARQFPKNLSAVRASHPVRPALVCLENNRLQAAFVAQRVLELRNEGIKLNEMAVLYRAHYHSMEVQMEMTKCGIPFQLTSGLRFFEQAHTKDVAAFLKFVTNPRDEISFKRIVRLLPGIGDKTADSLWTKASAALAGGTDFVRLQEMNVSPKCAAGWKQLVHTLCDLMPASGPPLPPSDMIKAVIFAVYEDYMKVKFPNYESRREDLSTLAGMAEEFDSAEVFLSELALLGTVETSSALGGFEDSEKITLSSLHQAKGLEWKVVFLIWLTDGSFPTMRSLETEEGIEEERRLFYVGVTRCQDELYLTWPELRIGGDFNDNFQRPSRFLTELPENLMEPWEINPPSEFEDSPF